MLLEYYEKGADGRFRKKRSSLGRVTRELAMAKADQAAVALRQANRFPTAEPVTVAVLFDNYFKEVTPIKGRTSQRHDRTCIALCQQSFGPKRAVATLGRLEWDRFIRDRRSGALRPPKQRGRGVRDRQVQYDCKLIRAICNWGMTVRDAWGQPLLDRNPFVGLPVPREESPQRPELSDFEYQAMLKASHVVHSQFRLALVLMHETGHRLSSVRQLRWSDIDLKARTVHWRAETDKIGFDGTTTLADAAARALVEARGREPMIGATWVFPAQRKRGCSTSRHTFAKWWATVATEAKLPPVPRRQFHSLRRKFATEMKHAPLRDLAYLGGWKSVATVVEVYQRPDAETMQRALAARRPVDTSDLDGAQLGTTIRHQAADQ